jgi:cytochrome c5
MFRCWCIAERNAPAGRPGDPLGAGLMDINTRRCESASDACEAAAPQARRWTMFASHIDPTPVRTRNARQALMMAAIGLGALIAAGALAQTPVRSGKQVVEQTCVTCHGTGRDGAPRIGDNAAWAKRASQGLSSLTQTALAGIRKMPAHGGKLNLSDTEVERAVTYMVNQSGGKWIEPVSATAAPRSGEQVVKAQCMKCHGTGTGGAPKIGDRAAWTPRIKQGLDAVVRSAIHGHGGMPARGGMADATDAEIRAAVLYMFNSGSVPAN